MLLFGSRVGGTALTFAYTILVALLADQATLGLFMLGLSVMTLGAIVLTGNLEAPAIRYIMHYRVAGAHEEAAGYMRFSVLLTLGMSLAAGLGLALLLLAGVLDWSDMRDRVVVLAVCGMPVVALSRVWMGQAAPLGVVVRGLMPVSLGFPFALCALLAGHAALGGTFRADWLMAVAIVAHAGATALQRGLLRSAIAAARRAPPAMAEWRGWMRDSALLAPHTSLDGLLKQIAITTAGLALPAAGLAEFGIAISVIALLLFAMKAVDLAASPDLSRALAARDGPDTRARLREMARIKALACVAGALLLIVAGHWALTLIGEDYASAYPLVLALVLLPAADALFGHSGLVLNVSGRSGAIFATALAGMAAIVGGVLAGAVWGGPWGAALGCGIGYALHKACQAVTCVMLTGIDTMALPLLRPFLGRP